MRFAGLVLAGVSAGVAIGAATEARAELPPQLRVALDAAISGGDKAEIETIAKYLKVASPADAAEIDARVSDHRAKVAAAKAAATRAEIERKRAVFAGWKGEGQVGLSQTSGNTEGFGASIGVALTKEGARWRHNLRGSANFERNNGRTSRNQQLVAFEPNYKFDERLFSYGLAQYERDEFAGFHSRTTLSGGVGYRVLAKAPIILDVKGGVAWRRTDFIGLKQSSEINKFGAADLQWKISPQLTLTENATGLYSPSNTNLTSLTALNVKLGGKFTARASYQVGYNSDPPPHYKTTDTLSRFTLVYGF